MRTLVAILSLSFASVALTACGSAQAGDDCNTNGYACEDPRTALECVGNRWKAIPCRGDNGCEVKNDRVTCDVSRNQAGDACAISNEGQAICHITGTAMLECRSGAFVQTKTCSSCVVAGDEVSCAPQQ